MSSFREELLSEFDSAVSDHEIMQHTQDIADPKEPETVWALYGSVQENAAPQRMPVLTNPFSIGRHPENSACIPHSTVSGHHAEILMAGENILIRDCDSTNGTLLNGKRLKTVEVLRSGDILHFGNVMFTVEKEASSEHDTATVTSDSEGEAIAQVHFNTLMSRPGIQPYFQPIVELSNGRRIGYEVLTRSLLIGLETPAKMFRVAAQRTSEAELSRICRIEGMRACQPLDSRQQIFLNTHPAELNTTELFDSLIDLRDRNPEQAVVLEVHESGVTSVGFLRDLRARLNDLNIGLAYDDFGAGQARLTELIEVPPDVLKFDVQLIQGLPSANAARRDTVAGLIKIVRDLNVVPLAEGVETEEEAEICLELGFDLGQGYLFGRGEPIQTWLDRDAEE